MLMENIVYTRHARKRLEERFISEQDVENAVRMRIGKVPMERKRKWFTELTVKK